MTGKELFTSLTNPDFNDKAGVEYAQTLMTIWSHIDAEIFSILEEAESKGKKLEIKPVVAGSEYLQDELTIDDVILV